MRESFNAFRELKTLNVVKFFTSEFKMSADESANAVFQINLSASIPRLLIELVLIIYLCVLAHCTVKSAKFSRIVVHAGGIFDGRNTINASIHKNYWHNTEF